MTIKGYDTAKAGQMLVKDDTDGLSWQNVVTDAELRNYVQEAADSSKRASDYATNAGNEAVKATQAASTASRINEQTMNYVNDKFWWGTMEEYNALESISADTFYFIREPERASN